MVLLNIDEHNCVCVSDALGGPVTKYTDSIVSGSRTNLESKKKSWRGKQSKLETERKFNQLNARFQRCNHESKADSHLWTNLEAMYRTEYRTECDSLEGFDRINNKV